jgi:SAM-dependent methyltransferase
MASDSLDSTYFERVYSASDDPWHFATSAYEAQKYRATLDALPGPRFDRALEIGCSIGVLTAQLAERCGSLLSVDVNERALASAAKRCAKHANVRFAKMSVPRDFPDGAFDLILVSEVGYYWSDADLARAVERIAAAARGGIVELVHFLPKVEDYPRDGDSVHDAFLGDRRFTSIASQRAQAYRIDVLRVR